MHLLLDTNGLSLSKKSGSFLLQSKSMQKRISPKRITSISITSNCQLSTAAIQLAIAHQIPIFICSYAGKVLGKCYSKSFVSEENIRIKQFAFVHSVEGLSWIIESLILKSERQLAVVIEVIEKETLKKLKNAQIIFSTSLNEMRATYNGFIDIDKILLYERQMGKVYWNAFRKCLPNGWSMKARALRPAEDIVNSAINYGYGFLYTIVEHALYVNGLNPYQAILHKNKFNDPTLVFDIIEPFRPYVDKLILQMLHDEKLNVSHTIEKASHCYLTKEGKRLVSLGLLTDYAEYDIPELKAIIYSFCKQLRNRIEETDIYDIISGIRHSEQ